MASYTVKQGDSLLDLAKKFGVSTSSLLAANAGVSSIQPGVTLRIPTTTSGIVPTSIPEGPGKIAPPPPKPISPRPPFGAGDLLPPPKPVSPRPPFGAGDLLPPPISPQQPPPRAPRRFAPPPQPTYVPPAQSMAGLERPGIPQPPPVHYTQQLEARRVQQQPVVGLTGAQPTPQQARQIPLERRPGEPTPGARFAPTLTQQYMARLFQRGADYWQQNFVPTETFRKYPGGLSSIAELAANAPSMAMRAASRALEPTPSFAENPELRAAYFGRPDDSGNAINRIAEARAQGQQSGTQWVRYMMSDGNTRMFNWSWDEETTQEELLEQRASHVGQSLRASDRPQIILESDREILNLSVEDMQNMGYFWDEDKGHWVFGEVIEQPQTYGTSLPGWGYNYPPRRGGGRGGGGSYSYPSYLPREQGPYPQSFLGRQQGPFPQSFVGREQPGGIPQQAQTRAARFGAITWRI